jgi:iron complex outermembrane receptor protein
MKVINSILLTVTMWLVTNITNAANLTVTTNEIPNAATNFSSAAVKDSSDLSLEQLVNIEVTSVSKKEESLQDAPAAIYVITQEDIRRSGLTSIPELLRMVPGLDVAQIDANHWAISSRGFNSQYANKLLVLIDGRTVYSPSFGGVFWNVRSPPLEDIDRIEVIRGPGATLWGANAVNGVINIITKSAKDTQGGLVTVTYGTEDQPSTFIQYGGQFATNLFYRAYLNYFNRDNLTESTGKNAADGWDSIRTGAHLDWEKSDDNNFTLQGDYYYVRAGETVDLTSLTPPFSNRANFVDQDKGGNVLGRWTHNYSDTSQLTLQTYYDHSEEGEAADVAKNDTYDFDLQHRFELGKRQDIVWGAGYRYEADNARPSFFVTLTPQSDREQLFTTFLQDDITVVENRLHLIIGSKLEHNDSTGFEIEPSVRLAWTPTEKQTVWAAVSRAVRTPADEEQDIRQNESVVQPPLSPPIVASVFGNPNLKSEVLTAYELGYRIKPVEKLSFDLATFYNVYDDLITPVQGAPYFEANPGPPHLVVPLTFQNVQSAQTYGGELMAEWRVTGNWKLTASYSLLQSHYAPQVGGDNASPENQFQIHSYLNLPGHVELNAAVYYVDQITTLADTTPMQIPSYVRLDIGATWRPCKSLELGIFGQNLLDDRHVEFTSFKTTVVTDIPRGIYGKITWHF